ncbi:hypothetical protein [Simkania negevensis]|uniref:Uncharacterized protein n=1 Tax=Simkania negevensis (strain ATCC VR-1471 / DSM 27360 / Z) TaxID=331113 RepID=F8L562_SIMNZ|nr:hypothetical protein [Simkania negevensis]CCB87943.1 unknown protein [Simkania negevensis Z]
MDYVWQFLLFIAAGLVLNRIEEFWARQKEIKKGPANLRKNCIEKIRHCINELDLNAKYIGGPSCPCKTDALERLVYSEESTLLDEDLINSLKQLIAEASIARTSDAALIATRVKSSCKLLKDLLQKRSEDLTTSQKT